MRKTSTKYLWMGGGLAVALVLLALASRNDTPPSAKKGTTSRLAVAAAGPIAAPRRT